MIHNVLMVGVGGQGIILASDICAAAAMHADLDTKKSEIHGMSQRGGSVFSHIRFGPAVSSPVIPEGGAHYVLSLEMMEPLRWLLYTDGATKLVTSDRQIKPANVEEYPVGIREELERRFADVTVIDEKALQKEIAGAKFINVALLGALSVHLPLPVDAWERAISDLVPPGTFEKNRDAFSRGRDAAGVRS